jgi:hypothetical protein
MKYVRIFSEDKVAERQSVVRRPFRVVIAYDCRRMGNRAMNVYSNLVRQFGAEFDFHCELWRFDVLRFPEAYEAAVATGAAGDLIIVSASSDNALPGSVKNWLEEAVAKKPPGSAALLGILESSGGPSAIGGPTCQLLQSAADRSLIDFILDRVEVPQDNCCSLSDFQTRGNSNPQKAFSKASRGHVRGPNRKRRCRRAFPKMHRSVAGP